MKQKYLFLESEGDRWFERNRDDLVRASEADPIDAAINSLKINPKRVLEIGCSNGWRLARLRDRLGCEIMGIEPSMRAAMAGADLKVPISQSTAASLPVAGPFDLVIYGFCLYLTDPGDWLLIASEGDRVLADGGYLIIHDFAAPKEHAYCKLYEHNPRVRSYHVDWSQLWLGHPNYWSISTVIDEDERVTVLRKGNTIPEVS
jgi:SAM-dependent methyltransferase